MLERQEGKGLEARTRTLPCRVLVSDPTGVEAIDRYGSALPNLPLGAPKSLLGSLFNCFGRLRFCCKFPRDT